MNTARHQLPHAPPVPRRSTFLLPARLTSIALAALLGACGGGGNPTDSAPLTVVQPSARALASTEPVGSNCATGGARIDAGIDSNGNGVLDAAEITATQYVCSGSAGAAGPAGAPGAAGRDGMATLIRLDAEPLGANCAAGGTKVSVGLDANANGVLDAGEVSATPKYVCGGAAGAAGTNGTNGINGTNGTNGTNGRTSLMAMTPEAAGVNCAYGGTKVSAGLDSDGNGVLAAGEVTSTSYNCDGAPGAGISWVTVSGTSQQATSGVGYLADNASQVIITLPTAPSVGELIEVSGVGTGGWSLAQNAAQTILTKALPASYANYGASWSPQVGAGSSNWGAIASSADGSKLVAAGWLGGRIYTSTDSGQTWTARESNRNWFAVASSSDGTKLVAAEYNGQLYTSDDAGVTWTARDSARQWFGVASSADGSKLVASVYGGGQLYTSVDSGVSWTARESNRDWIGVASSADGSKLVAANPAGLLYTSTDSGVTWTARATFQLWEGVASSADGNKLVALANGGRIWTSSDSGVNWTPRESNRAWIKVASSSDGSKLAAVAYGGMIYTSTDSGVSWTPRESNRNWYSVAMSADGSKLWAGDYSAGFIYTSTTNRTTVGTTGSLSGSQYDAVKLQYIGNGSFLPLGWSSFSGVFQVR